MAEKYYSILTNRGKELEAQSSATGKPVIIKDFVVGDGNGQAVKPDPAQTKLAREVYRNAISALQVSPDQANQFIAQLVLAAGVGGFVVREVGLLTDAGELYSVANCAAIEKPENGVSVNLQYRLAVSESANIELKAATGDGLFLRIDKNLSEIAAKGEPAQKSSREAIGVLDATTARKGLVQLSSAIDSTTEALAATPKAVKAAYDLANGKYTAQDATTVKKGIVQLSSATDSTSETLAATPKAVKAVNDELNTVKNTLGTAASKDVQTSKDDITAGRVLVNGGALALRTTLAGAGRPLTDFNDLPANSVSFGYDNATNTPGFTGSVLDYAGSSGKYRVQLAAQYNGNGNRIAFRTRNGDSGGAWNAWGELYHTRNKPTASDVDAVSATNGGTFQKEVGFNGGLWVRSKTGMYSGNDAAGYTSNNMLLKSWYGIGFYCTLTDANQKETGLTGYINTRSGRLEMKEQIIPGNYTNFDARYQAKGNYTPAGQAYTKAESDARYGVMNGFRRGGQQLRNPTDVFFGNWESPAGCVVTGITMENRSDGRKLGVYYRQMQYLNKQTGAWVNVGD
ncbi:phage tail protein [Enterobacter cancerogenus]|uniref:phage tail protein n=1 Tax=Enterobacter cancerogenus TaxID=69218 RepID=UPI000B49DB23|nr:phage tail protein [Enterobacter cancerogenus]